MLDALSSFNPSGGATTRIDLDLAAAATTTSTRRVSGTGTDVHAWRRKRYAGIAELEGRSSSVHDDRGMT
jgi:hypothetical protein